MAQNLAYLRVTTLDQDLEKNKFEMRHLANDRNLGQVRFVEEKVSGKVNWRLRKIAGLLSELTAGDTTLRSEFARRDRSILECMEIVSVAVQKGIRMYPVKGAEQLDPSDFSGREIGWRSVGAARRSREKEAGWQPD